jgi:hypothetical protein
VSLDKSVGLLARRGVIGAQFKMRAPAMLWSIPHSYGDRNGAIADHVGAGVTGRSEAGSESSLKQRSTSA